MRKITEGPFNDIHPFYLPDGKIAFVSTRTCDYVLCQPGAGCALHVMNPDGSNIQRIHFGTLADHTRPGTSGSRDACKGTKWFADFNKVYSASCTACHGNDFYTNNSGIHHTWINLTNPVFSQVLNAPLAKSAGGLDLCQPKDGKIPRRFKDRTDKDYQLMLTAIEHGKQELYSKPRMDMPGAVPLPYPQNFVGPFTGFAGP